MTQTHLTTGIYIPDTVENALTRYLRGERAKQDQLGRKRLEQLSDNDPLFLARGGQPYSDAAFRAQWKLLMKQVETRYGVSFTPHTIRHLFVTNYLSWIKEQAPNNPEEQRKMKEGLRLFMGWRSRRTMEVYDHTFSEQEALLTVARFQQETEQQMLSFPRATCPIQSGPSPQILLAQDLRETRPEVASDNVFVHLWESLP